VKGKIVIGLLGFAAGVVAGGVAMHVKMKMDEQRPGPAPTVPGQTAPGGAP
jgi:hypothetical protein